MAVSRVAGDEKGGQGQWFVRGKDHGKPVRARIRGISTTVNRDIRRRVYGGVKSRKQGNQPLAADMDRLEDFARERAVYALVDVENWSIVLEDEAAVAAYAPLLGLTDAQPGVEVYLDGKLTEDLKRLYLSHCQNECGWISDKAQSLVDVEIEEEEAATEAF